jgi:hypothetical protein
MFNPTILRMIVEVHRSHLLEEAKKSAMPRGIRAAAPRFHERLLLYVSDRLISAGLWLQARYRPAVVPCTDPARGWCLRQAGWHSK